jgi:uroporphyrinogen-III synthase
MTQNSASSKTVGVFKNALNKKLIELFKSQGKKVFEFPALIPKKANLKKAETESLKNISAFDWLIFSDIRTVEIFLEILEELEVDFFELDNIRICSRGEAVADSLRFRQIHSDVIPPKNSANAVFSAIAEYVFDENELNGLNFLIIKSAGENSELANLLKNNSAKIFELEIYEIENRNDSEITKLKTLTVGGAIDEFVFNAPEDVFNLAKIVGIKNLPQILAEMKIQAFNEITLQTLSEFDVKIEN